MKNLCSALIIILGWSITAFAQEKGTVEFGANLGYNTARVTTFRNENTNSLSGINLGVSAEYYFSNRWGIKGKLIYDAKGWAGGFVQDLGTGYRYPSDFKLNYITIPILANWHFGPKRNWYLNFGPYVGFLMSAKTTYGNLDVKEGFNANDFGLTLGIGVKIPVAPKLKLLLEYEGQSGYPDVFKSNSATAVTNTRGSFNVGVNFLMH